MSTAYHRRRRAEQGAEERPMTVADLIARLSEVDPDEVVGFQTDAWRIDEIREVVVSHREGVILR